MKKVVLLAALTIVMTATCVTAGEQSWQSQLKAIPAMAKAGLGITADQEKSLDAIYAQTVAESKQVWSSAVSDNEKISKLTALSGKFLTSSMDVLTKDQLNAALTMGSMWIQSHEGITILKSEVIPLLKMCGLTDSQMAHIDKSLASHVVSAESITKNNSLTTEQKDSDLWKLRQSTYDAIRAGLQPDQQTAMDLIFKGTMSNYEAVRNKLPADLKPKFDAFVKAIFAFTESKVALK